MNDDKISPRGFWLPNEHKRYRSDPQLLKKFRLHITYAINTPFFTLPMKHAGFYLWGGPGTIDLLKVKYFDPRIDENGYLEVYDPVYLERATKVLGVTDVWATFSWGFSDEREIIHREFIAQKLPGMKKLGLTVYGYVQGFNVVTDDFSEQGIFCRDPHGKLLPYSKGRSLTCPNNPAALNIIRERVGAACRLDFDGIYIDNILFGLLPFFVSREATSFFGCSCSYCRKKFEQRYGYSLQPSIKYGRKMIEDYLEFRTDSVFAALQSLRMITHGCGKRFGINLYDFHRHHAPFYFGYDFRKIEPLLDYYLIENHAFLPGNKINNCCLKSLAGSTTKPLFVVSYNNGIGMESAFTQQDLDLIYAEAAEIGYFPCIKGSEFTTNGRWHVLKLDNLKMPGQLIPSGIVRAPLEKLTLKRKPFSLWLLRFLSRFYPGIMRFFYNNRYASDILYRSGLMRLSLRSLKNYDV